MLKKKFSKRTYTSSFYMANIFFYKYLYKQKELKSNYDVETRWKRGGNVGLQNIEVKWNSLVEFYFFVP